MLVFPSLLAASALARPPDLTINALPLASSSIAAPLASGRDALYWVGSKTDILNRVEIAPGTLVESEITSDVYYLFHAIDHDGDGVPGLLGMNLDGDLVDFSTGLITGIAYPCHSGGVPGDVNGDGTEDFITVSTAWLGQVGGFRRGAELAPTADTVMCPQIHPVGDLDGDGRGDFVRAEVQAAYQNYGPYYDPGVDSLELYLGEEYAEPSWAPRWRIEPEPAGYSPALAVVAADLDGDGVDELLTLAGTRPYGTVEGELQVWTDLLNASGPTLLTSESIGGAVRSANEIALHNLGDLDGDGDDEVLVVLENLGDSELLRIIDAELDGASLYARFGEPFDLPFTHGAKKQDLESFEVDVGDFDGDGTLDVAVAMVFEDPNASGVKLHGTLAFWLSSPWQGKVGPDEPAVDPTSTEAPATQGCACASGGAPSAPWLLALVGLALSVRRRSG